MFAEMLYFMKFAVMILLYISNKKLIQELPLFLPPEATVLEFNYLGKYPGNVLSSSLIFVMKTWRKKNNNWKLPTLCPTGKQILHSINQVDQTHVRFEENPPVLLSFAFQGLKDKLVNSNWSTLSEGPDLIWVQ